MKRPKRPADLIVSFDGPAVRWIYTDEARCLLTLGEARIMRASHVEPLPAGGWTADLSPVNGPTLGPFTTRTAALAAEVKYLTAHVL